MGDLNFKKFIVIFIVCFNSIFSVHSVHSHIENQSQIKNSQSNHQPQYKIELTNYSNSKSKTDNISARYLDQDVDEFDNDNSDINPTQLTSSSSSSLLGAQITSHDSWERKSKPLRNIFMGIYKNYKSTYLGNKTSSEFRKSMQDSSQNSNNRWTTTAEQSSFKKKSGTKLSQNIKNNDDSDDDDDNDFDIDDDNDDDNDDENKNNDYEIGRQATTTITTMISDNENNNYGMKIKNTAINSDYKNEENLGKRTKLKRRRKKKKNKGSVVKKDEPLLYSFDGEYRYNIGPGVNISLDMKKDVVSVNLDEECLKEILLGRWVDENEGRGKKYEMISKILPLFILPFLIQSAIIPFLVSKLKLLLIKSILVGKLAIFLLVVSAIKNNQKVATYEPAAAYWAAEPSRRSEIYNGYRVEGRPTTWVQ